MRFILQWVRADYYNPLAQFVLKVTNPLVVPARRLLPSAGGIDLPTLVVLIALEALITWLLIALVGIPAPDRWFALYVALSARELDAMVLSRLDFHLRDFELGGTAAVQSDRSDSR